MIWARCTSLSHALTICIRLWIGADKQQGLLKIFLACTPGGAMGSADEVNIQASELNRTMKVCA